MNFKTVGYFLPIILCLELANKVYCLSIENASNSTDRTMAKAFETIRQAEKERWKRSTEEPADSLFDDDPVIADIQNRLKNLKNNIKQVKLDVYNYSAEHDQIAAKLAELDKSLKNINFNFPTRERSESKDDPVGATQKKDLRDLNVDKTILERALRKSNHILYLKNAHLGYFNMSALDENDPQYVAIRSLQKQLNKVNAQIQKQNKSTLIETLKKCETCVYEDEDHDKQLLRAVSKSEIENVDELNKQIGQLKNAVEVLLHQVTHNKLKQE